MKDELSSGERNRKLELAGDRVGLFLRGWNSQRRNLFKDHRRIVEHPQFEIATRSKDMLLPIGFQGIGDSWRKKKSAFVATQVTSRKALTVTASIKSEPNGDCQADGAVGVFPPHPPTFPTWSERVKPSQISVNVKSA
jgi:hypothetical protein